MKLKEEKNDGSEDNSENCQMMLAYRKGTDVLIFVQESTANIWWSDLDMVLLQASTHILLSVDILGLG